MFWFIYLFIPQTLQVWLKTRTWISWSALGKKMKHIWKTKWNFCIFVTAAFSLTSTKIIISLSHRFEAFNKYLQGLPQIALFSIKVWNYWLLNPYCRCTIWQRLFGMCDLLTQWRIVENLCHSWELLLKILTHR